LACSGEAGTESEPLTSLESELAVSSGLTLWHQTNQVVKICFTHDGFESQRTTILTGLAASWQAYSGLIFVPPAAGTECPADAAGNIAPEYMPIAIVDGPQFGGSCVAGYGARKDSPSCGGGPMCQCSIYTAYNEPHLMLPNALHEVGHGLGVIHEHQRSDRPANIATTCPGWDPASPNYTATINDAYLLTPYDGPSAQVNYCANGSNPIIFGDANTMLSPMDKLGIEILYPKTLSRRPILTGFADSAGLQTVVRSGANLARTDWIARGAHPSAIHNQTWRNGATGVILSNQLSPTLTITSDMQVQVTMEDFLDRIHFWSGTQAIVSDARHAAITLTTTMVL
jgi:hypothetical protein